MMGHREKMKGGAEYDAFTGWRRYIHWRPGGRAWVKRKFWKRTRKSARKEIQNEPRAD